MNNREIKFRVWDKQKKAFNIKDSMFLSVDGFQTLLLRYPLENDYLRDCIIQQYTSLKDKNEKEIYEGDIVETIYADENHIGEIIFDINTCAYRIKTKQNLLPIITYRFDENYNPKGFLQVVTLIVGNIFENSDLII